MSIISDDQRLMFLVLSHVSPCELETKEGLELNKEREKSGGKCPSSCPFSWYCRIMAATCVHFTRDVAELVTKHHLPLKETEAEAAEAVRLILKVFAERKRMMSRGN